MTKKTYEFEAERVGYLRFGTTALAVYGAGIGPVREAAPVSGPGAASLGRGPYFEPTPLAAPAPEVALALPPGLTRTAGGLEVSEPDMGFGSAFFGLFADREADLADYLTPDHGRIELLGGWAVPVVVEPANSVILGLVNATTGEYAGLGVIGSGMSGTSGGLGAAVKLGLDPVRVGLGPLARRRLALSWTPADLVGVPGVSLGLTCSAADGSGDTAELSVVALDVAARADWRAFLEHPDTQPGLYVSQDSMGPGSPATPALLELLHISP